MDDLYSLRELSIRTFRETYAHLNTTEDMQSYLNEAPSQTDVNDSDALEIERIYVAGEFQNKGLDRYLVDQAVHIAAERKKKYIWLGVWNKNEKAIHFYEKNGFYKIGTHIFIIGEDAQTDYIMRKDVM